MDKEPSAATIEALTAACMELPWLDEIRMHMGHVHAVTIIPPDDVSTEEKLMLTFVGETTLPQRVSVLMQAIATALGFAQPITAIVHGGGRVTPFTKPTVVHYRFPPMICQPKRICGSCSF